MEALLPFCTQKFRPVRFRCSCSVVGRFVFAEVVHDMVRIPKEEIVSGGAREKTEGDPLEPAAFGRRCWKGGERCRGSL